MHTVGTHCKLLDWRREHGWERERHEMREGENIEQQTRGRSEAEKAAGSHRGMGVSLPGVSDSRPVSPGTVP